MDDQDEIRRVLKEKHRAPVYIHSDAALFGGFFPYLDGNVAQVVNRQIQKFDSIAVSGHKFFGFDEPMGIFICNQETFKNLNQYDGSFWESLLIKPCIHRNVYREGCAAIR